MPAVRNGTSLNWINVIATIAVLFTAAGGGWLLVQSYISGETASRREAVISLDNQIKQLTEVVREFRAIAIVRSEHNEFKSHVTDDVILLREQLRVLEQTRPTTGELQTTATNSKEQVAEVKDRIKSIEDYLRTPRGMLGPTQAPSPNQR